MSSSATPISGQGNIGPDLWGEHDDGKRHRAYCFTNFGDKIEFGKDMRYLLQAPEICPNTGKLHWQGYVVWNNSKTRKQCSHSLGKISVFEARGSIEQQLSYIRGPFQDGDKVKPYNDNWEEHGKRPCQGKRGDLKEIQQEITAGSLKVDDIVLSEPMLYHQYGRTLEKIEDLYLSKQYRTEMTKGIWYYGKTGVGKSLKAFEEFDPDTHYVWPRDGHGLGWWDGYIGQETVILNDFRGEIRYNIILDLVDRYPTSVPRRNRRPMPFVSKLVIITSSLHPRDIYVHREEEDSLEQLYRRFEIIEMKL